MRRNLPLRRSLLIESLWSDILFCGRLGLKREKVQKDTVATEDVRLIKTKIAKHPRNKEMSDKTIVKIQLRIDY